MSKKMQDRKKKNRERAAKQTVLRRREAIRKKRKYDESLEKAARVGEIRLDPIVNPKDPEKVAKFREFESKVQHNIKLIEALEQEHKRELEDRKKINEKLEDEGCHTLKEKMDYLEEKTKEILE